MIVSKIRGTHKSIPIGKIRLAYLYESIRYACSIHPLYEEKWSSIQTSNISLCLDFVIQNASITSSPSCKELGFYIKTLMAILNHPSHRTLLSDNLGVFCDIFSGFQSNPNLATVSKCSVYKIPFGFPHCIRTKNTTYYLLFNFVPLIQSQKFVHDLSEANNYGKSYIIFVDSLFIVFHMTVQLFDIYMIGMFLS